MLSILHQVGMAARHRAMPSEEGDGLVQEQAIMILKALVDYYLTFHHDCCSLMNMSV